MNDKPRPLASDDNRGTAPGLPPSSGYSTTPPSPKADARLSATLADIERRVMTWLGEPLPKKRRVYIGPDRDDPEPVRTETVNGVRITWYVTSLTFGNFN